MSILNKTFKTAEISLQKSLIYKKNLILNFFSGIFGLAIQLIFWIAFFDSGTDARNSAIAGYRLNELMTYSVIIYFFQRCTSMMNISNEIKDDIMSGKLNIHLIRPVKYLWIKWITAISGQLPFFSLSFVIFLCLLFLFGVYLVLPQNLLQILLVVLFTIFSYIISFMISCIIGMLSFWILETQAFNLMLSMGISILSGAFFPIDFIHNQIGSLIKFLPFSYLAYVPTQIYLGKINNDQIVQNFIICGFWIFVLATITSKIWKKGVRQYSAFGG